MFKNSFVFVRNLVFLVIACNTLYWLFPFRPIVWRLFLVLSALYLILFKNRRMLPCEKSVLVFAVLNLFYVLLSAISETPTLTMIGNILCAMLSLNLFTILSEHGVLSDRYIAFAGLILAVIAIPYYYHYRIVMLEMMNANMDRDITNNGSTLFLMLLPMVFLMKNTIEKWIIFMMCLIFIIMSAKRGNIVAAVIPSLLFVLTALKEKKRSIFGTFIVIVAIIIAGYFLYNWSITNDYLLHRVEETVEGNSSERDVIYSAAWDAWINADSPITFLFGRGYNATLNVAGMDHSHAHNDWLEILVDYGLFGFVIYLLVFITLFKQLRLIKGFDLKVAYAAALFIWFFKTLYSMGFTEDNMPILMITIGTVLGRYKTERLLS